MFSIAVIIGIYSYLIFFLGLSGVLYKNIILGVTILFIVLLLYFKIKNKKKKISINNINFTKIELILISVIFLQVIINLIGVLGPEISFDSLWYHLTLPKLYLLNNSINFIPGGLLYYSAMPKLIEMLYIPGLSFGFSFFPKLISFSFGILSLIAIYYISRIFLNSKYAILASLIFYSNLVVGWESITSYVDLARVFFELMALWGIINWIKFKERKWFYESAVMLGLAVATKLNAVISLFIFLILIFFILKRNKKSFFVIFKHIITFLVITFFIPLPWFIFSYLSTGNPLYPYFSMINLSLSNLFIEFINPINYLKSFLSLFLYSGDPISPIYILIMPLLFAYYKKADSSEKIVVIYLALGIVLCILLDILGNSINQIKGGTRFMLSYLSLFSVIISILIYKQKNKLIKLFLLSIIFLIALSSIVYRGVANAKFLPVILKTQSKETFLSENLNFNYGDFYDTDGFFKRNIKKDDVVLLYGFHNLYYVDFPFIHSTWVKKGDAFNYIATQDTNLEERFKNWKMIYQNPKTKVKLYNLYGLKWHY